MTGLSASAPTPLSGRKLLQHSAGSLQKNVDDAGSTPPLTVKAICPPLPERECKNFPSEEEHPPVAYWRYPETMGGTVFYALNSVLTITKSRFESSRALDTGTALTAEYCSSVSVTKTSFQNTRAGVDGGALHARGCGSVSVAKSSFQNTRAGGDGGALHATHCSSVSVAKSSFQNNTADGDGGAVSFESVDSVVVKKSLLERNKAVGESSGNGGGLYAEDSVQIKISDSIFRRNQAALQDGGAIYAKIASSLSTSNSTFERNSAQGNGGAVLANVTEWDAEGTKFIGNSANRAGGAVSLSNGSWVPYCCNVFKENVARFGGAVFLGGPAVLSAVEGRRTFCKWRECEIEGSSVSIVMHSDYEQAHLERNVAVRGGGIFCKSCGRLLVTAVST